MTHAIILHGEAPMSGSQIVTFGPEEMRASSGRLGEGEYIWTRNEGIYYMICSGTPEARAAAVSFLNAKTSEELGALTSRYGYLSRSENHSYKGGTCAPVAEIRRWVEELRRLNEALRQPNGFSEVNPPPNGLVWHPFAMQFGYWLLPDKDEPHGFRPVLEAPDLYTFLVHEIVTLAYNGYPLLFCAYCKKLRQEPARRDCRFCSDACRLMAHRERHRRDSAAGSKAVGSVPGQDAL
ncbi:hypothetical protein [Rhizobium leguminosarum]|uniref:hypothetical protein n=1 Tax=Rhizobium leguminosarum TaxID=384 RepID=UPI00103FA494|nr:hypothetical protein [Rhizobium leguminosarum]MBB4344434.1 hypothetical protein [Rhizobium leguminosarum]MBB6297506.1 hypothetical protein [Rhizobium leguminosarum]TCA52852.1 hypothetical protein E0H71_16425 [Rhizobium leguminosarum bv. viciae]TCA68205.1 hypothetical protein E0H69_30640 [Rhizobium leguminosarum bv. viciae]